MQVVIPMAGLGSRFKIAGYKNPKPLIELDGKPMIVRVLENIMSRDVELLVLIMSRETEIAIKFIEELYPWAKVHKIVLDSTTDGPASTVWMARKLLSGHSPLLIANSDQIVAYPIAQDFKYLDEYDGVIWAMRDKNPKWSFVKVDENMLASFVAEKQVISDLATVGMYGFKRADYFFDSYTRMVENRELVNNEYYVAPAFNHLFPQKKVIVADLGNVATVMFGLGTPEDLEYFMSRSDRMSIYEKSQSVGHS